MDPKDLGKALQQAVKEMYPRPPVLAGAVHRARAASAGPGRLTGECLVSVTPGVSPGW